MWHYAITFKTKAQKELEKLPSSTGVRILEHIETLKDNPFPNGHKKLKNFNLRGIEGISLYRIRVGNYRVVYSVLNNQLKIEIIRIGHRKNIYSNN